MQILGLLIIWFRKLPAEFTEEQIQLDKGSSIVLTLLLIGHVYDHLLEIYRRHSSDVHSIFTFVQYFYMAFLFGFILQKFINIDRQNLPEQMSMRLQWIVIDLSIMITARIFINAALYYQSSDEVAKSMYSIRVIQDKFLVEERVDRSKKTGKIE
jgi:DMSO reductase anchor subunit